MPFWDSTVYASILGGFIAGLAGFIFIIFQNHLKKEDDKQASKDSDIRKLLSIKDYLTEIQKDLHAVQNEWCPCHVVLPFIKQIEFDEYDNKNLLVIRNQYNLCSLKLHALETFIEIQGDPIELDPVGKEQIAKMHKLLRNEILEIINNLTPIIESFLQTQEQIKKTCPFKYLCDSL